MTWKIDQYIIETGGDSIAVDVMTDVQGNVGLSYLGRYEDGILVLMTDEEIEALGNPWSHLDRKQQETVMGLAH